MFEKYVRNPERTKQSILLAAERLIAVKGIQTLTLEEVATAAAVSKGGLLHHFSSKQALISGLAQRMITEHEQEIENYRQQDPAAPGAYTRAYLRTNLAFADKECSQVCATLTAESRNFPAMREMFQKYGEKCRTRSENDGLDPVIASVVWYAVEGLMSVTLWGMPRSSNYDAIISHLLKQAGGKPAARSKKSPK
jgi:AcrR family transcriptional regulator